MKQYTRCLAAICLAVCMLLCIGCGKKPVQPPADHADHTSADVFDDQVTTDPSPLEDMEIELGVDDREDEETTVPTQPNGSQSATQPDEKPNSESQIQSPTQPDSDCETTQPDVAVVPAPGTLTYQEFYQMDPERQEAYIDSFDTLSAFNKWFNEAKAEYESTIPDETVNGTVDIGKLNP